MYPVLTMALGVFFCQFSADAVEIAPPLSDSAPAIEAAADTPSEIVSEPVRYRSGSPRFRDMARELAGKFSRETRAEADFRLHGAVSYADQAEPQVGDQVTFQVDKNAGDEKKPLQAVLKVVGKHCYVYLEKGRRIDDAKLQRVAGIFDKHIYPKTTATFGSEWKPGIDGNPRITLLLLGGMEGCDGFFYPGDEYTADKSPGSNEREMLYLSIERLGNIEDFMGHLVAHELQHMIHWHNDPNETFWVEEGLSEYAATLFNRMPWTAEQYFQNPDRNLLDWEDTREAENYGHVFLFIDFLLSRPELSDAGRVKLVREIVRGKSAGVKGLIDSLAKVTSKLTFDAVFRDFSAAAFLHASFKDEHPYRFSQFVSKHLSKYKQNSVAPRRIFKTASGNAKGKVSMWSSAAYAFALQGQPGRLQLEFTGSVVKSSKGNNLFWLGVALTDSAKKQPPKLLWLKTSANCLKQAINLPPAGYDQLLLIVCNQGPMRYLDGDGRLAKAEFSFSLSATKTRFDSLHEKP